MATTTTNYGLTKPESTDLITPTIFATNFDLIDGAIAGLVDDIAAAALTGGLKLASGSYTGTNTYGSSAPTVLSFNFAPKLVIIYQPNTLDMGDSSSSSVTWSTRFCILANGMTATKVSSSYTLYITWGTTNVSFYTDGANAMYQYNRNVPYKYVAIG